MGNKGITLVALVITIIILIILAGISISIVLGEDGLIAKAKSGADKYNRAATEEQALLDGILNTINDIKTPSIPVAEGEEGYAGGGSNKPYVPTGFTHTEGTWNGGYTIKDKTTNDEFVWVPCSLTASSDKVLFARVTSDRYNSSYDFDNLTDYGDSAGKIRTSVGKYGGFYIAKYEASEDEGKARSIPNASIWTWISFDDAVTKSEQMVSTEDGIKSALISGECWDTTLQWMIRTSGVDYDTDSVGRGWYAGSDSDNPYHLTGLNFDTSGATIPNKVNNIWDMAGNAEEMTSEFGELSGSSLVMCRGGGYGHNAYNLCAATRNHNANQAQSSLGFRVVLYKE